MAGEFADRVVVISGAARGQGLSHASAFARAGAHVVLIDVCAQVETIPYPTAGPADLADAHAAVDACGPGEVRSYRVDVRDAISLPEVISEAAADLGGLDIAVANAGVFSFAPASWQLTPDQWRACCDTILFGSWNLARSCIPHMLRRPGANIVFIGSVSAHKGIAATGHYVAAKHGVVGLMKTLAIELAPHGIRSNLISPTATNTIMATSSSMQECVRYQESAGSNMANLLAVDLLEPAEVTDAVIWVSSARARHVTGACLPVDAGFICR